MARNHVRWLRTSYLVGAVADGFFAVAMAYPPLLQAALRTPTPETSVATRSALAMGASLMAGWTVLLLWANAKPIERKGILLITIFPVIVGLALTALYGLVAGYTPLSSAISVWVFQAFLIALFLFSYFSGTTQ